MPNAHVARSRQPQLCARAGAGGVHRPRRIRRPLGGGGGFPAEFDYIKLRNTSAVSSTDWIVGTKLFQATRYVIRLFYISHFLLNLQIVLKYDIWFGMFMVFRIFLGCQQLDHGLLDWSESWCGSNNEHCKFNQQDETRIIAMRPSFAKSISCYKPVPPQSPTQIQMKLRADETNFMRDYK